MDRFMFDDLKSQRQARQKQVIAPTEDEILLQQKERLAKRHQTYTKHRKLIVAVLSKLGDALFGDQPWKVEDQHIFQPKGEEARMYTAVLKVKPGSALFRNVLFVEVSEDCSELNVYLEPRIAHGSKKPLVQSGFSEKELVEALRTLVEGNKAIEF
jgi:hypothetical protein